MKKIICLKFTVKSVNGFFEETKAFKKCKQNRNRTFQDSRPRSSVAYVH